MFGDAHGYVRIKLLTGELRPLNGELNKNGRLRMYVSMPPFRFELNIFMQRLLFSTPRRHARPSVVACSILGVQVPRKNGTGIQKPSRQFPDQRYDRVAFLSLFCTIPVGWNLVSSFV